jgi:hypothetical protein
LHFGEAFHVVDLMKYSIKFENLLNCEIEGATNNSVTATSTVTRNKAKIDGT